MKSRAEWTSATGSKAGQTAGRQLEVHPTSTSPPPPPPLSPVSRQARANVGGAGQALCNLACVFFKRAKADEQLRRRRGADATVAGAESSRPGDESPRRITTRLLQGAELPGPGQGGRRGDAGLWARSRVVQKNNANLAALVQRFTELQGFQKVHRAVPRRHPRARNIDPGDLMASADSPSSTRN